MSQRTLAKILAALSLITVVSLNGTDGRSISPALADTTTSITFDDLPPGTAVSNQYDSQGVDFLNGSVGLNEYCYPVIKQVSSQEAESADQVADISCANGEFPESYAWAYLKNSAENVSVYAGFLPDFSNPPSSTDMTLYGYDDDGNVVAQDTATVPTNQGVHTLLQVSSGTPNITQISIQNADDSNSGRYAGVAIDNLTFDNPGGVPPDFRLAPAAAEIGVPQGSSSSEAIQILRLNGSTGGITFGASGLPSGVHASFSPNPADGESTTLTLSADPNAPTTSRSPYPSIDVSASPDGSSAGPSSQSASIGVNVYAPFTVQAPQTIQVPPCSTVKVPITVDWAVGFSGNVSLSLSGVPSDDQATLNPTVLSEPHSINSAASTLTLTSKSDVTGPAGTVEIAGASGELTENSSATSVIRVGPSITGASPGGGMAPQALKPGTVVTIYGHGFCPGTTVDFGNSMANAPALTSTDGTRILTAVPRLATSGALYAIPPDAGFDSPGVAQLPGFDVNSYRNVNGFSFNNSQQFQDWVGGWGFTDIADVFGVDQTFIGINPCWPFYDCTIHTPFPTPGALIEWGLVNAIPWTGRCFGFSVASQRLLHGDEKYSNFPLQPGAIYKTIWNLQGPDAADGTPEASPDIAHYINDMQIEVVSSEFAKFWLQSVTANNVAGSQSSIINQVTSALQNDDHPIITLVNGGVSGFLNGESHAVVAYDVENGQNGDKIIDVYNPDAPYIADSGPDGSAGEDADTSGMTHQEAIQNSQIIVDPSGHWTFAGIGPGNWSGGPGGLVVAPYGNPPVHPTLPLLLANGPVTFVRHTSSHGRPDRTASQPPRFRGLWDVQTGSASIAQVTNSSGHTLLNPNGTLDTSRASGIPDAAPLGIDATHANIVLLGKLGGYSQTVTGKRSGDYRTEFLGSGMAATIDASSRPGIVDKVSLLPDLRGLQFGQASHGAASRPLTAEIVVGAPDGSERTASLGTTMATAGSDRISFGAADSSVVVKAGDKPVTYSLTLSGEGPNGLPQTFISPKETIASGTTASLSPGSWSSLQASNATLKVTQANGHTTTTTVKNMIHPANSYSVTLHVVKNKSSRRLTISAKFKRLVKGSSARAHLGRAER